MNKTTILSVVILAKNEEENVARAIRSIKNIADEILIIDDNSTDNTVSIASKLGAKVYKKNLKDFSEQRNFGLAKAKGDWVLFIDADEVVSNELGREIKRELLNDNSLEGYFIKRTDVFLGRKLMYGEPGETKLLRLAKKRAGEWTRKVHEIWNIKGSIGTLKNYLYHYSHRNISEFVDSINRFSDLHAEENIKEGKKSTIFKIIVWPVGKFFVNFVVKLGFLDGIRGFIYVVFMSFHSFLAWSKQWIKENK